jgi:hypothetical protein
MSQTTDSDHRNAIHGLNPANHDRAKHRDPAAEKRAAGAWIQTGGQGMKPHFMGHHPIGKSAVATHNRLLGRGAKVEIPLLTWGAGAAALGKPAETHAIALFEAMGGRAEGLNTAHHLMAGDERKYRIAPFVSDHGKV